MKLTFCTLLLLLTGSYGTPASGVHEKEYRSPEHQFSVMYPGDWSLKQPYDYVSKEARAGGTGIAVFYSPVVWDEGQMNMAHISVCSQPINGKLDDYARMYCRPQDAHLSHSSKDQIISRKQIMVGGAVAEEIRTRSNDRADFYSCYVSFTVKDRKVFISGNFRKSSSPVFDTFNEPSLVGSEADRGPRRSHPVRRTVAVHVEARERSTRF